MNSKGQGALLREPDGSYHLALYEGDPASTEKTSLLAVMPLYRKTNSWGEYVFDWSWANAYQSHGYDYYPKLVTAAPFTPSHGQRIFVADGQDRDAIMSVIVEKLIEKATSLICRHGTCCFHTNGRRAPL